MKYTLLVCLERQDMRPYTLNTLHANIQDLFNEYTACRSCHRTTWSIPLRRRSCQKGLVRRAGRAESRSGESGRFREKEMAP